MKHLFALFFITLTIVGCRDAQENDETPAVNEDQLEEVAFTNYGDDVTADSYIKSGDLTYLFSQLKPNDTVKVKVRTVINEVCAKKGCWIEVPVGDDQSARVTFKDYGFFLPKNSQGKEVVLSGKAFKSVTSVEDARHYAMDGGKSQEEIDAITEDQITLSIVADGALVETYEGADVFVPAPAEESE
ncbi:DUF4920 domain-containing protein [Nonlabens agnitus]|uniref:DUF4920 domain-containing protein n=1 Tax=Nonlabens agnitus TaxID=870484 RepID=A0A2S9WTC6_9FLAO|nr:DUF4920 domain-containing protein [Nonlabens agnitus]PRP66747.1 DUF4920 domain-containing protein [Nonlabens agnitus]